MPVNDYLYLPRSIAASYEQQPVTRADPIPFTPLRHPVDETRTALVTTAGIWNKDADPPFDYEREQREPWWGDPSYRVIPRAIRPEQIGAGHLHLNNDDILADFNIALPITRFEELVAAGEVGSLASEHYSFMGFQGGGPRGPNTTEWEQRYGPEVAERMVADGVESVFITPT